MGSPFYELARSFVIRRGEKEEEKKKTVVS